MYETSYSKNNGIIIIPTAHYSWLSGQCRSCGFPLVVTQPDFERFPTADYWWYCSNKKCIHHEEGEHTGDQEFPSFDQD